MDDPSLHLVDSGPPEGPTVAFLHALGTDHRIWDDVVARLPSHLRLVRIDLRGHGRSPVPPPPYGMGALIADVERALDDAQVRSAVVVGLSLGGLIAQGLAVKRLDLCHALVLSNTAAKIGTPDTWRDRIDRLQDAGLEAMADEVIARWVPPPRRDGTVAQRLREVFLSQSAEGYAGCCAAIGGTDFYTTTAGLRLATLVIAGDRDAATPPDLVRETADLIPGARFELLRGCGHIACVDDPDRYASVLRGFLDDVGYGPD